MRLAVQRNEQGERRSSPLRIAALPQRGPTLGEPVANAQPLILIAALLSLTIFFLDLLLPAEMAASVLYLGVIWLSTRESRPSAVVLAAIWCSLLAVCSAALAGDPVGFDEPPFFNSILSLFALWVAAAYFLRERAAEERASELSWVANATRNAVIICDAHGRIRKANEGLAHILGLPPAKAKGRKLRELLEADGVEALGIDALDAAIKDRRAGSYQLAGRRPDGARFWINMDVGPMISPAGRYVGFFIFGIDVTEQKAVEEELAHSVKYAATILETVGAPLLILGSDFHVVSANKSFYEKFALAPEQVEDRSLFDLGEGEWESVELRQRLSELLATGEDVVDFELEEKFGKVGHLALLADARLIPAGTEPRIILVLKDVTGMKQALAEVESSNAELKQFAYVASHDMQEPLRKISCYLQILEEDHREALEDEAKECIDYAVDGAQRMQNLITDLLRYSGISEGAVLNYAPVDTLALVERVLDDLEEVSNEKDADILIGELPTITADGTLLEQVFQNLISNALKYTTPERRPVIRIEAKKVRRRWIFTVADNGIGFEPEFRERIFIMFQRLHKKNDYPGTGIGLALCRKIVERHRGKIWAEGVPGEGASFSFSLPER